MTTNRVFSGSPWEEKIAYCRAIRRGNLIFVSGTAPVDDNGQVFEPNNAYAQTKRCLHIIEQALEKLGARLSNVVRTRLYVTDISQWNEYGRAHQEAFSGVSPATTMVEIKSLIDAGMTIEVEVDAVLD